MAREKRFNIHIQDKHLDSFEKIRQIWNKGSYSLKSVQAIIFMANLEKAKLAAPLLKILEENGDNFSTYSGRTSGAELRKQFIDAVSIIIEAENPSSQIPERAIEADNESALSIEQEEKIDYVLHPDSLKTEEDFNTIDDFEFDVKEDEEESIPDFFFEK